MPDLDRQVALLTKNTMGLSAQADYYSHVTSEADIIDVLQQAEQKKLALWILGGGSNVIFRKDFQGLVIHMGLKGVRCTQETEDGFFVTAQAGEHWDDFLQTCQKNGWHGLDNLAIIPGTVGAAPVQNIGAYGQEVADCIERVRGIDTHTREICSLDKAECQFGYRDSLFKHRLKGRFIITAVDFYFKKNNQVKWDYAPLKQRFKESPPSFSALREAIIAIRESKLPSPSRLANCGSFFKSPILDEAACQSLLARYPDMPYYPSESGIKLSAGWLIEQTGLKGKRIGPVGIYQRHALVLVNYGGASYAQLAVLIQTVKTAVAETFGIVLEQEPDDVSEAYRVGYAEDSL